MPGQAEAEPGRGRSVLGERREMQIRAERSDAELSSRGQGQSSCRLSKVERREWGARRDEATMPERGKEVPLLLFLYLYVIIVVIHHGSL